MKKTLPTSCGTLVINQRGEILLCHVTGTKYWDLPKGMQDPGENPLQTAQRELWEETGLVFDETAFEEIGDFDFRPDKRLHLFKLYLTKDMDSLGHLICTSHFMHRVTGVETPEVDAFRWAGKNDIPKLCGPRMTQRLLDLDW